MELPSAWRPSARRYWDPLPTVQASVDVAAPDERAEANGHRDFAAYLDGDLEPHLRAYLFWLGERRDWRYRERLAPLGGH
jgi:hypothetical protein